MTSFLQRVLGRSRNPAAQSPAPVDANEAPAATEPPSRVAAQTAGSVIEASTIDDIVRIEETTDAEFFVGPLFRRKFGSPPPDFPKHYVAFYALGDSRYQSIGYIHYSVFEDSYLCGGMVIDDRLYRRMPAPHRRLVRSAGGIAEIMLRATFARLSHAPAIWGHVGNKQALEVDRRVGFEHTHHPHVMVVWNAELSPEERAARLARVIALGPF